MNYKQTFKQSIYKIIGGIILTIIGATMTIVSLVLGLYHNSLSDHTILQGISRLFQNLAYSIYEKTPFLNIFWENCPTPNISTLVTQENFYFLLEYILLIVGILIYKSGKAMLLRLKNINKSIEDTLIAESIHGTISKSKQNFQENIVIEDTGILKQLHILYFAPILVGIILKLLE